MSEQSGQLPADIVKVEVEDDDKRIGGNSSDTLEGDEVDDKDMEVLKAAATLLSNGTWLSCGMEVGESLAGKLLSLGKRLQGWKEWERLGRRRQEENRVFAQRLTAAELQFEMMKESKVELRETYDLEVERRIRAKREVTELREKIAQNSGPEVPQDVNLDTDEKDLREGQSAEAENTKKLANSCNRSEFWESSGSSSELGSDDVEGGTNSDDNIGRTSSPELRRQIAPTPQTQVLPEAPVQLTASSKPDSRISGLRKAHHIAQVEATARFEKVATSEETSSDVKEAVLPEQEDTESSLKEITEGVFEKKEVTRSNEAVLSDSTPGPHMSHKLRRRSNMGVGGKAVDERVDLKASPGESDDVKRKDAPLRRKRRFREVSDGREKRFPCDRCEAVLTNKYILGTHMKKIHGFEKRGRFSCYCCNKQFLYKSEFVQHLKTHPEDQSYKCKPCGKLLKNKNLFRNHMKTHDVNREKTFTCPTCSKTFFTSTHLACHLVTHQPEKPFKCPECPLRFKLPGILKKHLIVHSDRKPFQCELCVKNFKRPYDLEEHMRVHTGERPYTCLICKKAFTTSRSLKIHVRTHLGEEGKIHQCPFCSRKFGQKQNCLDHQRRRHKSELASAAAKPETIKKEGQLNTVQSAKATEHTESRRKSTQKN